MLQKYKNNLDFNAYEQKIIEFRDKISKLRRTRLNSICSEYINYAPEIANNQVSPWRIISGIAEKHGLTSNTVMNLLRKQKIYCGKNNPVSKEGVDEYLKSL